MFKINSFFKSTCHLQTIKWIILLLLSIHQLSSYQLISTIDNSTQEYQVYTYGNFVGLSMYFDDLYPYLNNTLLRGYLNNSRLNNNNANLFHNSIHMPLGYKYSCSSDYYGDKNIVCLFQLSKENDVMRELKKYIIDFQGRYKSRIGFDVQQFNYTNSQYHAMLVQYFEHFSQIAQIQFMDRGDKLIQYYNNTVYTPDEFVKDIKNFENDFYYNYLSGPGLSQDASLEWHQKSAVISSQNSYAFTTYRIILFKDISQATIQNLLSQNYTAEFLTRRFTVNGKLVIEFLYNNFAINEVKLMEGMGIDGVTNSFAAAIWALDFTISFAKMKGKYIDFFTTFKDSYQSVIGKAPNFEPSPIYYGIMLTIYCLSDYNVIYTVKATGNNSQIKAYIFGNKNLLIINKDTNPNLTGYVQVKMNKDLKYLSCIYMQAPSLNATTGIKLGGIYWTGNNSDFFGQYQEFIYYSVNSSNVYHVNISYAQVAYCRYVFSSNDGFVPLKRGRSKNNGGYSIIYSLVSIIVMLILIN